MGDLRFTVCVVFIDDCCIFGRSYEEHLANLDAVLGALDDFGMKCNAKKCVFMVESFKFLGHIVSADGVRPDPDKLRALSDMVVSDIKSLRH